MCMDIFYTYKHFTCVPVRQPWEKYLQFHLIQPAPTKNNKKLQLKQECHPHPQIPSSSASLTLMMSSPPISSPLTYTCGYVGQLEYVFSPCRTSSSDRMSKLLYWMFWSLRICTICLLKPASTTHHNIIPAATKLWRVVV